MIVTTLAGIIQHTPRLSNTRGQNGERVLNLNVGVRQRVKKDGQWTSEMLWVDVALFGSRADGLASILKKGSQVGCTGELRVRRYEGRDGTLKVAVEVVASSMWPLDWTPRDAEPPSSSDAAAGSFRATHRDELAGQRTRGGDAVRGQRTLGPLEDPRASHYDPGDDGTAADEEIPF